MPKVFDARDFREKAVPTKIESPTITLNRSTNPADLIIRFKDHGCTSVTRKFIGGS
jgi:hypothetical protein